MGDELLDRAEEVTVLVERVGVVAGADEVELPPVDATAVAEAHIAYVALGDQPLDARNIR